MRKIVKFLSPILLITVIAFIGSSISTADKDEIISEEAIVEYHEPTNPVEHSGPYEDIENLQDIKVSSSDYDSIEDPVPETIEDSIEETVEDPPVFEDPIEECTDSKDPDIVAIAKTLYGECRGIPSTTEKAAVVWCILNRVDSPSFDDTIIEVITAPYQFDGYDYNNPVLDDLYDLAEDVVNRWYKEKDGSEDVGRVLPYTYLFFIGDGYHNHFRESYDDYDNCWDWSITGVYPD